MHPRRDPARPGVWFAIQTSSCPGYCPAEIPRTLWQLGQQNTRLIAKKPRPTSISLSIFFSQWGQTGVMSARSISSFLFASAMGGVIQSCEFAR